MLQLRQDLTRTSLSPGVSIKSATRNSGHGMDEWADSDCDDYTPSISSTHPGCLESDYAALQYHRHRTEEVESAHKNT